MTPADRQDEIAAETGFDQPAFDDPGLPVEDVTKREPEVVRTKRAYKAGSTRPKRQKANYTRLSFSLADDCLDYLRFLVANGNATSLTGAVELCVRGDRAAQALVTKPQKRGR